VKLAKEVEDEFKGLNEEIHIAVMGCEVQRSRRGARADIESREVADRAHLQNGGVIRKVPEKEIVPGDARGSRQVHRRRKAAKTAAVEAE